MKFAINYSHQAARLLADGRIRLDRFKVPDWPWLVAEASAQLPVAVHFTLKARLGRLQNTNWSLVESLLEQTGTPYVNLHLVPEVKDYPFIPAHAPNPEHFALVTDAMLADVVATVEHFGAQRVIVENVPYRGPQGEVLRPAVEPDVIRRIVSETGCGLLLDISHARIAAHHLGVDAREYMQSLPTDQLRELHFTGLHRLGERLQDHLPVLPEDWLVLEWVLERVRCGDWPHPWLLAFEYGGVGEKFKLRSDEGVIALQAPRLYEMLSQLQAPAGFTEPST